MFTVNHEIIIDRSLEDTFKFISDSRNDPKWCPPVHEIKQIGGSSPEMGAKYTMVAKPGPKKTEGEFEIVDYKPNNRAAYKGENGMVRFHYHYEFSPQGDATKVSMSSTVDPKGIWKLLQPVMKSATKKVTIEEFENLKHLLEKDNSKN